MVDKHESAVMATVSLILLISYVVYVFMLHPWERVAIYAKSSTMIVSVTDCDTKHPIPNANVYFYNSDGKLLKESSTGQDGLVSYESLPQCITVKASYLGDKLTRVCFGEGESKAVNLCFDDPTVNPQIIYSTEFVGLVGAQSGDVISSKNYVPFTLSYPLERARAIYPDYYLFSNILWSESLNLKINVDTEITNEVTLSFNLKSRKGEPVTVVKLGGTQLFKQFLSPDELVSIKVPKSLINETMDLSIKCEFTGVYFWMTYDCELINISVTQDYYLPLNTNKEMLFDSNFLERSSATTHVEFINDAPSRAGVNVLINDKPVFSALQLSGAHYEGYVNTELLDLQSSGNKLSFKLTPGGNASFSDVKLWFKTENATTKSEELFFSVPQNILESASYYEVSVNVNQVLLGGTLILRIDDSQYEKNVTRAGWTVIRIDKEDVDMTNSLFLSARNAKFNIEDLRVSYN